MAAFWNRPRWARAALREVLIDAYREAAPEVLDETDPMHPANSPSGDEVQWRSGVAATDGLGAAEVRDYEWNQTYTGEATRRCSRRIRRSGFSIPGAGRCSWTRSLRRSNATGTRSSFRSSRVSTSRVASLPLK